MCDAKTRNESKDVGYPSTFYGGKFKIYRRFPVKPVFYVEFI